jgi:hypothetical protein
LVRGSSGGLARRFDADDKDGTRKVNVPVNLAPQEPSLAITNTESETDVSTKPCGLLVDGDVDLPEYMSSISSVATYRDVIWKVNVPVNLAPQEPSLAVTQTGARFGFGVRKALRAFGRRGRRPSGMHDYFHIIRDIPGFDLEG